MKHSLFHLSYTVMTQGNIDNDQLKNLSKEWIHGRNISNIAEEKDRQKPSDVEF
jgi:hypothetical protein